MCCFFTILLLLGPRVAGITWWLVQPARWTGEALGAFNGILLPILGIIFVPWTTLMYVIVFPGGLSLLDWIFLALALFADIAMHGGGGYFNRERVPGMSSSEPAMATSAPAAPADPAPPAESAAPAEPSEPAESE